VHWSSPCNFSRAISTATCTSTPHERIQSALDSAVGHADRAAPMLASPLVISCSFLFSLPCVRVHMSYVCAFFPWCFACGDAWERKLSLKDSLSFRCRCSLFAPRTHSQFCSLLGVLFGYVRFLEVRENCERTTGEQRNISYNSSCKGHGRTAASVRATGSAHSHVRSLLYPPRPYQSEPGQWMAIGHSCGDSWKSL